MEIPREKRFAVAARNFVFDKTVWLAAIPVIAIICTYIQEVTAAAYWQIPLYLIKPEPVKFIYTICLMLFYLMMFEISDFITTLKPPLTFLKTAWKVLLLMLYAAIMFLLLSVLTESPVLACVMTILVCAPMAGVIFLIYRKIKKGGIPLKKMRYPLWVYAILLILSSVLTGAFQFIYKTDFQIAHTTAEFVVLVKYDNSFICKSFSRSNKTIGDTMVIIPIDEKNLILVNENVGPLKPRGFTSSPK
ncbi:MAG TPA: hypothetical protein VK174_08820 [Chitinophagales bacterium]|nr:hypothetical protein [Chitinophagales bacterium]